MTIRINGAGAGGAPLSDATPQAPGTAAAGTSTSASRGDHVHTPTTAAQAGAIATSLLTTRGDVITRGASAAQRLALGTSGTVLSSDGTDAVYQSLTTLGAVPTSRTVAGAALSADISAATLRSAINTRTSGTLAALPASPVVGDTYEVTSGTGRGRTYQCLRAGLWTRQRSQQIVMLDNPSDYTVTQPATTTVAVTTGNISQVLASGSNSASAIANVAWPAGVNQFRLQFRVQLTTTDNSAQNVSRAYIDWGSLSPCVLIELNGGGRLAVGINAPYTATLIGTVNQGTSPWVAVEVVGTSVRVWTCINTSDDESACVWLLTYDGTMSQLGTKGAPTNLTHYALAESRACTASVSVAIRNITIRDTTY